MSKKIAASAALVGIALVDAGAATAAPAYNWTGVYIGGEVGGWQQSIDYSGGFVGSATPSGFIGGGYAGYNYQLPNNLVFGVEGRIDGTSTSVTVGTYAQAAVATGDPLFRSIALETAEWVLRDLCSPEGAFWSTLDADSEGHEGRLYVAGGGAFADECLHFPLVSESNTRTGWTVSAGAEINFSAVWSQNQYNRASPVWSGFTTRVEWRHSDFGTVENFGDLRTKLVSDAFLIGFSSKIGKYRA